MTPEEAMKVGALALDVDGRCPSCAGVLLDALARVFPERGGVWRAAMEASESRYDDRGSITAFQVRADAGSREPAR